MEVPNSNTDKQQKKQKKVQKPTQESVPVLLPEIHVGCLHGSSQSAEIFHSYMENFERIAKQHNIMLHFLDAMYSHPLGGKSWYKKPLDVADVGKQRYDDVELDVDSTNKQVDEFIKKYNITVIIAFSQGTSVADAYLVHCEHPEIKKAVYFSGYQLVEDDRKKVSDVVVLNVTSDTDTIVPSHLAPMDYVDVKDTLKHDKGHKIPGSVLLRSVVSFIVE